MKKLINKKSGNTRPVAQKNDKKIDAKNAQKSCAIAWSASIYVYWFIILFFIAATFYILGRSHNALNTNGNLNEETLMQASDYYDSAKVKLLSSDLSGAINDLNTAIETGGASINAYILRGEAYMQSGDYNAALTDFNNALEQDSENAVAYYDRALLNIRLENYSAALTDINNALGFSAGDENSILQQRDLYAKRGQLNLWLKNFEGAVADFTNSLARPEGTVNPSVYSDRAEAYTALGQYQSAIDDYATAIRVISEQIQAITTSEEREKLSNDAMAYFEKSAALNVKLGKNDAAYNDLESASAIAKALNATETETRVNNLMSQIKTPELNTDNYDENQ